MTSLEVRIPISPRADYFNRIQMIALSIREFYPDAVVRVTVGADEEPQDIAKAMPWSRRLGVEWAWVPRADFAAWRATAHPYIATMMERFRPPFYADHVLMIDADVIAIQRFDDLLLENQWLSGVMAHGSPFGHRHIADWEDLFRGYGLGCPTFEDEHSGWRAMFVDEGLRFSPPYFNTGVLSASAAIFEQLYAPYMHALQYVRDSHDTYFVEQLALTLAIRRADIPIRILPLRYNFPNQPEFDRLHPEQLLDVRLLHFLRTGIIDREKDFATITALRQFAIRHDLRGSNEVLRQRIGHLLQSVDM